MDNFYTYAYLREDGTPYYIGKGRGKRIHEKNHVISVPPKERRLFLKQNLTEEESFKHEIYMISILGRKDKGTGILRNLTDGGEGTSGRLTSDETRRKIGNKNKGKRRENYPTGKNHHLFGKKRKDFSIFMKGNSHYFLKRGNMYEVISPQGDIGYTYKLKQFCLKNNLDRAAVSHVVNYKHKHHKGWIISRLSD